MQGDIKCPKWKSVVTYNKKFNNMTTEDECNTLIECVSRLLKYVDDREFKQDLPPGVYAYQNISKIEIEQVYD